MAAGNELDRIYQHHEPTEEKKVVYANLRSAAQGFASLILRTTKPSREQALALTKIEEAMMWANAGVARNE